ncbi:AAA family ATPase [Photobacterium leiognathi]|uniref:AAA family ATPase n=1 Tax=Photobacterium leiognathi TaxID=553611 RepID=UPI001EDF74D3|nr:AAA family ATPase [Photobacterium leiognathi]MCG3883358.1 AAA family ATPase [Photobacterium leiognathi]
MFNIKKISTCLAEDNVLNDDSFVLKGLLSGGYIGMLIAAPGIGKSHLVMSIAMEAASGVPFVGLGYEGKKTKTLLYSSEDPEIIVKDRFKKKLSGLSEHVVDAIDENMMILSDELMQSLVLPINASHDEKREHKIFINKFIAAINKYDLLIIDTVSESMTADLVSNDQRIKNELQSLARKAGVSILLVHHINKEEIKKSQEITVASGASLTYIMRLTKFMICLTKD